MKFPERGAIYLEISPVFAPQFKINVTPAKTVWGTHESGCVEIILVKLLFELKRFLNDGKDREKDTHWQRRTKFLKRIIRIYYKIGDWFHDTLLRKLRNFQSC